MLQALMAVAFVLQPAFKHTQEVADFLSIKLASARNAMPFFQTTSATAGRGMLGHKYRMAAEGCSLAIVGDPSWLQAFGQKILCMLKHGRQAFLLQVCQLFALQVESPAKSGFLQRGKYLIQWFH